MISRSEKLGRANRGRVLNALRSVTVDPAGGAGLVPVTPEDLARLVGGLASARLAAPITPRRCLRIYFSSRVPNEPRFVIGHVGRHFVVRSTS